MNLILMLGIACVACSPDSKAGNSTTVVESQQRLFIIGQDLGAIRGYYESGCCIQPDGNTSYVNLYNVFSESLSYSGLGIDPKGEVEAN